MTQYSDVKIYAKLKSATKIYKNVGIEIGEAYGSNYRWNPDRTVSISLEISYNFQTDSIRTGNVEKKNAAGAQIEGRNIGFDFMVHITVKRVYSSGWFTYKSEGRALHYERRFW